MQRVSRPERTPWLGSKPAFVASYALSLTVILGVTAMLGYPGFQDFGEWIYQAGVLSELLGGGEIPGVAVAPYPVPLALPQLLLTALVAMAGPVIGAVLYLLVYAAAGAAAIQALVERFNLPPLATALVLTGGVVLSSGFWNGFIGNQWGLIAVMGYLALSRELATRWWVTLIFGMLTFFTHGLAFASWGLIALSLNVAQRRFLSFVAAVSPSVGLAAWYLAVSQEPGQSASIGWALREWVLYKFYTVAKLGSYHDVLYRSAGDHEVLPLLYWLGVGANVAFGLVSVAVLAFVLSRGWRATWARHAPLVSALGGLVLVYAIVPTFMVGIVNPGERVLNYAAVLAAILILQPPARPWLGRTLALTVACGFLATHVGILALPMKGDQGGPPTPVVSGTEGRLTVLFSHRTDQFDHKVRAAADGDFTLPLAWHTSILVHGEF